MVLKYLAFFDMCVVPNRIDFTYRSTSSKSKIEYMKNIFIYDDDQAKFLVQVRVTYTKLFAFFCTCQIVNFVLFENGFFDEIELSDYSFLYLAF